MSRINILTFRFYRKSFFWQQVYEWEEVLKEYLKASYYPNIMIGRLSFVKKQLQVLPLCPKKPTILFEMNPDSRYFNLYNKSNIIPWIIDFYIRDDEKLEEFYSKYDKHKYVLISSIEVYNFLKKKNCPLNIIHMPLTLSDRYRITGNTSFNKMFDVLVMGRTNDVLLSYLQQYSLSHPNIEIVSCKKENGHLNYYNQNGVFYGNADSRESLLGLLRKSRIGLYTEKGIIGDNEEGARTQGFCHVTPRLFEYMMTGNHVIAKYVENTESDYFELPSLFPNTDSYDSFEKQMNLYLTTSVDMDKYSAYLEKHYTSTLVEPLTQLLNDVE